MILLSQFITASQEQPREWAEMRNRTFLETEGFVSGSGKERTRQ